MSQEMKTIKLRAIIEYEIEVPIDDDDDFIEFHYNESSWCQGGVIEHIEEFAEKTDMCLCGKVKIELRK